MVSGTFIFDIWLLKSKSALLKAARRSRALPLRFSSVFMRRSRVSRPVFTRPSGSPFSRPRAASRSLTFLMLARTLAWLAAVGAAAPPAPPEGVMRALGIPAIALAMSARRVSTWLPSLLKTVSNLSPMRLAAASISRNGFW